MNEESLYLESIELLKELISTQSFSFHEENTATLLENWLNKKPIPLKDMLIIYIATISIITKKNLIYY